MQAADFEGPLHIRNSHPMFLATGSPSLISAEPENALQLDFTYSSTYMLDRSQNWFFGIDLEAAVLEIGLKKKIGDSTELSLDVPVISYNSGFLDSPLASYHKAFGFADYGRSERPLNDFLFNVTRDGREVFQGKSGEIALGDIRIGVKRALTLKDPLISIQAFANLPSGDPDRGYGSGRINGGAALLLNKRLGSKVMAYLNAGYGLIDRIEAKESVSLRNYLYGGAGVEWACSKKVLLNGQVFFQQSPFRDTGVRDIDTVSSVLSFGGRYRLGGKSTLGFSFSEDPTTAGAPDFMVGFDYKYRF